MEKEYIESIISSLPEDDKACVFSIELDIDLIWVILDVSLYKKGYKVIDFGFLDKPAGLAFYMSGDEIAAFSSYSLKESLHEFATDKGIPESLFNDAFAFMESKSPLNTVVRDFIFVEIIKKQVYKIFEVCKKSAEFEEKLKEDREKFNEIIEQIKKEGV